MSFPRYAEYKDSGVEWLGEVPAHWTVARIKCLLAQMGSGGTPATDNQEYWSDEEGCPWVAIGDMSDRDVVWDTTKRLTPAGIESKGLSVWPRGTLLFSMYASLGHVAELGMAAATNQAILALLPNMTTHQRFLKRWFEFLKPHLGQEASSNTQDNLNAEKVRNLPAILLPLDEQQNIAVFLDHETAKIDALVAEQEKLIDLLKEKRQAVISHAVTKGLNPDAPMKDSGIEWLGEVPAHWAVARLSYNAVIENGTTPSRDNANYWFDGDIPWLSSGEVNQYRITEAVEFITQQALDECSLRLLPKGTVVIGMIGQGKTRGLSAYLEIEACINQNLAAIVPGCNLQSDYLLFIFQSVYEYLREFGRGGNQAALNCGILSALKVPLPPLEEQVGISNYLCARLKEFEALTSAAQRAVDLLKERRSALISAAVTGKIDVREFA